MFSEVEVCLSWQVCLKVYKQRGGWQSQIGLSEMATTPRLKNIYGNWKAVFFFIRAKSLYCYFILFIFRFWRYYWLQKSLICNNGCTDTPQTSILILTEELNRSPTHVKTKISFRCQVNRYSTYREKKVNRIIFIWVWIISEFYLNIFLKLTAKMQY